MELTLALPPVEAVKLARLPIIRTTRTGRTRGQALRVVWFDDAERSLAARGMVLAEQGGRWRLWWSAGSRCACC